MDLRKTIAWLLILASLAAFWGGVCSLVVGKPTIVVRAGPDITAPELLSATIGADGLRLSLTFTEAVVGNAGFTLDPTGANVTLSYLSGSGTQNYQYTISRVILESGSETAVLDYVAGDIEDEAGNALATIVDAAVENNSVENAGDGGAPLPPEETPSVTLPTGWDGAADVVLTSASSLQSAIDAADPENGLYIIELTAGDSWGPGLITINPDDAPGDNWLVIRTSAFASLPAVGDRLPPSPANDAHLAHIVGRTTSPHECVCINASGDGTGGASKVLFVGVQFHADTGHDPTELIVINKYNAAHPPTAADFTDNIRIHQCRIDEPLTLVGISGAGNDAVFSCNDLHCIGYDSVDGSIPIRIYSGFGIRVYNNLLEGEGVSLFFSDNNTPTHGTLPTDVTIDKNYLTRDMALKTAGDYHKNCMEIKGGERYLVQDNIIENSWVDAGGQLGQGVVIKNTASYCRDVHVKYNIVRNINGCFHIQARDFTNDGTAAQQMRRVTLENNLFYGVDHTNLGTSTNSKHGHIAQVTADVDYLRVKHNTFVADAGRLSVIMHVPPTAATLVATNLIWQDNIHAPSMTGGNFRKDSSATSGISVLNEYWDTYTVNYNGLAYMSTGNYDTSGLVEGGATCANNLFPTDSTAFGFANAAGDDYDINSGAYFTNSSTGGLNGADIDTIETRTANVLDGNMP